MVPCRRSGPFCSPAWKRRGGRVKWRQDKMITQVLSPQTEEIQTIRHSRIYGKTTQNFRPGAKDLPGCTNYTHLTEIALKSLN